MKVTLTYFRGDKRGKYYSEGEYETEKKHMFQIFEEVAEMARNGKRPGLVDCAPRMNNYFILVEVPEHSHNYPHLVLPGDI